MDCACKKYFEAQVRYVHQMIINVVITNVT